MKALTLTQPWASLVAMGAKRIETRSWYTSYRGDLAIHAAKGFPKWARAFTLEPICCEAVRLFRARTPAGWPQGAIVATCRLVDCLPTLYQAPRGEAVFERYPHLDTLREREFGDYSEGRYAWVLEHVIPFAAPVPAKGMLGLWEWLEAISV